VIELTHLIRLEPVRVWHLSLEAEPDAEEQSSLSASEIARARRFVFARDSKRYLSAHVQLRKLLAAHTGVAARSLQYREGPFGKPYLHGDPAACHFNLSHCGDVAMVGIADVGEVGIDVELMNPTPDAHSLAERHFTLAEQHELAAAKSPGDRDLCFLRGWTRKEACLKALGSGLSLETRTFEVGLAPDPCEVSIHWNQRIVRVALRSFRYGDAVVGAVARTLA
jgi:4'-phosphopantetheinyl transferase